MPYFNIIKLDNANLSSVLNKTSKKSCNITSRSFEFYDLIKSSAFSIALVNLLTSSELKAYIRSLMNNGF